MNGEPIMILLAEDDDGHANLIQRNLKRLTIPNEIARVRDGLEALDFVCRRGKFEARSTELPMVLLLDINMPGMDGIEVLRQMKTDSTTSKIPVIMLTTTDDPLEIERCYRLGCSAYVTKPVPYEDFAEAIKRLGNFLGIVQVPVVRAS